MKNTPNPNQPNIFSFWKNVDTKKIQSIVKPKENPSEKNSLNKENIEESQNGVKDNNNYMADSVVKKTTTNSYNDLKRGEPEIDKSKNTSMIKDENNNRLKRLRKIKIESDEDDEDYYKPNEKPKESKTVTKESCYDDPSDNESESDESEDEVYTKQKKSVVKKANTQKSRAKANPTNGKDNQGKMNILGDAQMKIDVVNPKKIETRISSDDNAFDYHNFTDATPVWARPGNIMDANKNKPGEPNYDPATLYIPQSAWDKLTPAMTQYWKAKRTNFDKFL